jgi:hypothetical protein
MPIDGANWGQPGLLSTIREGRPHCPPSPAPAAVIPPQGQTFAPLLFVHFTNQTLRQIVHTSIGGTKVRVFSNAYGSAPVTIGAGYIALREKEDSIQGSRAAPLASAAGRPSPRAPLCKANRSI